MFGRWQMAVPLGAALGGTLAPSAMAEEPAAVASVQGMTAATPASGRSSLLPALPSLRLSWPLAPRAFSFHAFEQGNYASGPLRLFRSEALWLEQGPFSLRSIASGERAFELDCRSTCQPQLERAISIEARLRLHTGTVVREAHAFARYEVSWNEVRENKKRVHMRVGLAGTFD